MGELVVGMNQRPFVCCKESWDMKDDRGNIHYLETWSLWRTSADLTPLKIEQEGGVGGAGRGGDTQVRGRTELGGISLKLSVSKT